jgi:integrase
VNEAPDSEKATLMARPRPKRSTLDDGTVVIAGKRPNGAGSTYFVASRGVWRATWVDPTTGRRRTVSSATRAGAERRAADAATRAAAASTRPFGADPDTTIAQVAAWWLDNVAATEVRPPTLHAYRKDVVRLTDRIGDLSARHLTTESVRVLLAQLRDDGFSLGTIRNTRARLRQVVEAAVELGLLPTNPVTAVRNPKATADDRKARRVLSPSEIRKLLVALDERNSLDAAVAILFTSGLRVSEVLGLAWNDLDLDAGTALVRRGSTYTGGGVGQRLDAPKTRRTPGIVHLAPVAVGMLRVRQAAQSVDRLAAGSAWHTEVYEGEAVDLAFTTADGRPRVRQNVTDALRAACQRAGIDPAGVGTHTGRRSTVTNLYADGATLDDVAAHVGHGSTETTRGYVEHLGDRPAKVARRAWALLEAEG